MQVATWFFMVAFAYGIGVFWYDLLPGKLPEMAWRIVSTDVCKSRPRRR